MKSKRQYTWGYIGKLRKFDYFVDTEPELSIEERKKQVFAAKDSWKADFDTLRPIRVGGYVPQTTPPPVETYNIITQSGDNIITISGDYLIWNI